MNKKKVIFAFLIILLIGIIVGLVFIRKPPSLLEKQGISVNKTYVRDIPDNSLKFSSKKIFISELSVFIWGEDDKLYVYNYENLKLEKSLSFIPGIGTSTGLGTNIPTSSHNSSVIAYVDGTLLDLWVEDSFGNKILLNSKKDELIDNDGVFTAQIFITGWSLEDTKLLYALAENPGLYGNPAIPKDIKLGFYLADFLERKIYYLDIPYNYGDGYEYIGWLSDNKILFEKNYSLFEYDISSSHLLPFEKFYTPQEKKVTFGFGQFDAAPNNIYVFSEGEPGEGGYSAIILYGGEKLETIKRGGWADYQRPRISPDGKFITFEYYYQSRPYLYNVLTKEEEMINRKGFVEYWLDNSQIILRDENHFLLYNVATKNWETIR